MNKIQKDAGGKIINARSEKNKIQFGGNLGVDVEATPESVKGRGGIRIFFRLPTLITLDLLRRLFKPDHNDEQ